MGHLAASAALVAVRFIFSVDDVQHDGRGGGNGIQLPSSTADFLDGRGHDFGIPDQWAIEHPANLLLGMPFSLTLMLILLAHEMGHYLYSRHYRVYATPPFFVPFPSLIGTLGAFIRIKSPIPSRAALFDIGIAGPIAGFIPACIALIVGLSMSRPIVGSTAADLELGLPLVFQLAAHVKHLVRRCLDFSLHPIAAAAWVGFFATALNLLPGGQLDGGHILFFLSPRLHRWVTVFTVIALIPLGKYFWHGWYLWAVMLALTVGIRECRAIQEYRGGGMALQCRTGNSNFNVHASPFIAASRTELARFSR